MWRPSGPPLAPLLLGALVSMCALPVGIHQSSVEGSELSVPPRHHPFPTPALAATPTHPTDVIAGTTSLHRVLRRRSAEDENAIRCLDFTVGTPENNTLKSPNFPNNYPNDTNCVRILDAGPGHVIRLEFREKFHVEPSAGCQYDFLEVRDGRYGYTQKLGQFCGDGVPRQRDGAPVGFVQSSGRYMYLRFRSDDTIEYAGFVLVYVVLPRPTEMSQSPGRGPEMSPCIIPVTGVEGFVNRSDVEVHCPERLNQSLQWHGPLDAMWVINVSVGWKIQLTFLTFKLDKPNDCQNNFVQVFKENTDIPSLKNEFCGAKAETAISDNNVMHVRFFSTALAMNSTFESLFTAYREGNKKPCFENEFDCQDDTCISDKLRCNGRINCRFLWDEDKDECKKSVSTIKEMLSSDHIIIILVIFCLILSGMCFAFLYNCTRKLVRDHRIIREHIRASRDARLDAAGKTTPAGSMAALRVTAGGGSRRGSGSGGGAGQGGEVGGVGGGDATSAAVAAAAAKSPRARSAPEDCYVPAGGGLLPLLMRASPPGPPLNGDAVFLRDGRRRREDGSSSSPRLFDDEDDDDEEDDDGDDGDLCDYLAAAPETRDNECQTRESLFLNTSSSEQTATPPPPPPPPPSAALLASRAAAATAPPPHSLSGSPEAGRLPPPLPPAPSAPAASTFSTFGHHPHRHRHPGSPAHQPATMPHQHQHLHRHQHYAQPPPPPPPPAPAPEQRFRAEAVIEVAGGQGPGARPYSVQSTKSAPDVIVTH